MFAISRVLRWQRYCMLHDFKMLSDFKTYIYIDTYRYCIRCKTRLPVYNHKHVGADIMRLLLFYTKKSNQTECSGRLYVFISQASVWNLCNVRSSTQTWCVSNTLHCCSNTTNAALLINYEITSFFSLMVACMRLEEKLRSTWSDF